MQCEVWPYEYAPDNPPLAWPADLPQFTSARWHRRKDPIVDEVRSLRLPFAEAPRLDSLMAAVRSRQALKIGGRKWAFSYRWIFPAEGTWWSVSRRLEY